ncbi:hypothetical protein D3C81_1842120 [compost metagenome]
MGGTLLINAAQLWSLSEDQELQVLNLRARLEELARVIGKGLPIQAIVTHCASLTGFSPSILGLPVEQRDLVINLPLAANQPNLMRLADHMRSRTECLEVYLIACKWSLQPLPVRSCMDSALCGGSSVRKHRCFSKPFFTLRHACSQCVSAPMP